MPLYAKDPAAQLDYEIDWSVYLQPGETLTGVSWTIRPAEVEGLHVAVESHDATRALVSLAGGLPGHLYKVTNHVTTSQARSDDRSLSIQMVDR